MRWLCSGRRRRAPFAAMPYPHKNIRLPAENYRGRRWHFVTMCCERRRRVFASKTRAGWMVEMMWSEAIANQFAIYAYCVMFDHLHVLVVGLSANSDLLLFIRRIKQATTSEFLRSTGALLWQKKFYDHILRQRDSVNSVAAYIWMNPVRKGICGDPKDYPFSGSFVLDWENLKLPREEWVPPWKSEMPA
jgi:putative transposase